MDIMTGILGILSVAGFFFVLPGTLLYFTGKNARHKRETDIEKLRYQKEILELEIRKQDNEIKLLEAESRKYDSIINSK